MSKREYKRFISNPGSPIKIVYQPVVEKDGTYVLKEAGVENIDEYIQSQVESTDINVILARCSQGDFSGLNQREGVFGDFTQVPKTFAEVLQLQIDAKNIYNKLTEEQKKEFDFDFNKFFASAGTDDWFKKVYGDTVAADVKTEEKESEVVEP